MSDATSSEIVVPEGTRWSRPAPSRRQRSADLGLAIGLLVAAALSSGLYTVAGVYEHPAPAWVTVPWMLAITLPLAVRRRHPLVVGVVVSAMFIVGGVTMVPELLVNNICLFLALYSVGAWAANRRAANLTRAVIVVGMLIWLLTAMYQAALDPTALKGISRVGAFSPLVAYLLIQILTNVLYFGAAWYFGDRARAAARERELLEERTRELELARQHGEAQAVALDRVRIARELHDVVAHHVSVIGIQAGAARTTLERDPEAARTALGAVEDTARAAIDELHELLFTLRDTPAAVAGAERESGASTLTVDALPALIAESTAAGVPTILAVLGDPRPLPDSVAVNLYRVAQEALTNVRKHAGPQARADVRLRYFDDRVELEIGNSGAVPPRASGRGLGLVGMHERVAATGGTLESGPRSRGGFLVRAVFPLTAVGAEARRS